MIIIGIDVETTGNENGICEFAAIAIDAVSCAELFVVSSLVDPGDVEWNPFAMRIHGITPAKVRGKPKILDVWKTFQSKLVPFAPHARLFAHNAQFDQRHLSATLRSRMYQTLECTLKLAKKRLDLKSNTLPLVCSALKIPFRETHRAEPDARAVSKIAQHLLRHSSI